MNKRYDTVMEKLEVTDAMRQRILSNIDKMELNAAPRAKVVKFPTVRRLMPIAACFVLLVAGVFYARYFMPGETVDPRPTGGVMVGNGIEDVDDAAALSEAVGFPVKEAAALPFPVDEVTYNSFWGDLAQITYTGDGQTVTFRQSVGDEDNSGDYNVYAETETREIGGLPVTLKGDGQGYSLVLWNVGTYAYSLRAKPALTAAEWAAVLLTF